MKYQCLSRLKNYFMFRKLDDKIFAKEELDKMLGKLKQKKKEKSEWTGEMKRLRGKIDRIDKNIIKELHKRWVVAGKIKRLKKRYDLKIVDMARMKEIRKKHLSIAKKYNVPDDAVKGVFKVIVNEAIKFQKQKNGEQKNNKK